jgi:type 1 glutamine amidotransferase
MEVVASMALRRALLAFLLAAGCGGNGESPSSGPPTPSPGPSGTPLRVLVLTATAGFRHGSIDTARQTLTTLGTRTGEFTVTATEDVSQITAARLQTVDVLMFVLTTGELAFNDSQKAAIKSFVENGGGFIGAHSATDTLYTWADYGQIVGAYFKEHPWTQEATVLVEDRDHPSTRSLGGSFRLTEEYYTFRDNPRPRVHVLLSLDASSVGSTGDYPLAWTQSIGQGRSVYTALGHFDATWTDPRFQEHLRGAINWAGKR